MSENQQNRDPSEEGGLFSENYEVPKRENPYLKKNREKAKAEKAEKAAKPKREKPVRAAEEVTLPSDPVESEDVVPEDGEESPRKRTFSDWMFEHVKLIATIATVLVVLSLVLITDVVGVVEDLIYQSQQASKEELTLTYVQGLAEKSTPITWDDLDKFRRDETKAADSITWMVPVKGSGYEVWISGVSTSKRPTYVYLFDMKTGDHMVLGADDFEAFIQSHS